MKDGAADMGGALTDLKVPPDMYEELCAECAPQTPSEHFGIPITMSEQVDVTVH